MAVYFDFINSPIQNFEQLIPDTDLDLQTGAVAIFKGQVRNDLINGEPVKIIEFTANEPLARTICVDILESAIKKYKLINAYILHSLGKIYAGETCFAVLIEASHRKEAFEALPYIVDKFKADVPVFGKEILENGTYAWKENQ